MENKPKMNTILLVIIIILLGAILFYLVLNKPKSGDNSVVSNSPQENQNNQLNPSDQKNNVISQNDTVQIPGDWKTFTDSQYGFSFQYPSTWNQFGIVQKPTDRNGNISAVIVDFHSGISGEQFHVEYNLPPNGTQLYQSQISDFNSQQGWYVSGAKNVLVAGKQALEANMVNKVNGRGTPIDPVKIIIVNFSDNNNAGDFELMLNIPVASIGNEVSNFEKVLTTFKFI